MPYHLLANAVLLTHIAFVAFVVGGLALIVVGNLRGWRWVNTLWFRVTHLAAILIVVAEALFGVVCPLTSLEVWLRTQAGESSYASSFMDHWLQQLLYYDAPAWVFTVVYLLFGLIVIAIWRYFPPRHNSRRDAHAPRVRR